MSQILNALKRADDERKQGQHVLSQKEALAHIVHASEQSPKLLPGVSLVIAIASVLGVAGVLFFSFFEGSSSPPLPEYAEQGVLTRAYVSASESSVSEPPVIKEGVQLEKERKTPKREGNGKVDIALPLPETQASVDLPSVESKPAVKVKVIETKVVKPVKQESIKGAVKKVTKSVQKTTPSNTSSIVAAGSVAKPHNTAKSKTNFSLRINVLNYDANPSLRFVVINGNKLRVGDKVPNSKYRISSIRHDGVIVDGAEGAMFVKSF